MAAGLWLDEASSESWLTVLLDEIACGEVEFCIPADDVAALDGIGEVFIEQELGGWLLMTCDRCTWRVVRRILDRYGADYVEVGHGF